MNKQIKRLSVIIVTFILLAAFAVQAFAMRLYVMLDDGTNLILEVEPTDSIDSILSKIEDKTEISRSSIQLFFNNEKLEEGKTLENYGIQANSEIEAQVTTQINLAVMLGDKATYFRIRSNTALSKMIIAFSTKNGLDSKRVSLMFGDVVLDASKCAADYGLKDGDVLTAVIDKSFALEIQSEDKTYTLTVNPDDTVADLKAAIALEASIAENTISLELGGTVLEDDKTLEEYEIDGETALTMTVAKQEQEPTLCEKIKQAIVDFFSWVCRWFSQLFAKIQG